MTRTLRHLLAAATVTVGLTACSQEGMNGPDDNGPFNTFGSAFTSAPVGMENTATSYAGGGDGLPWEGPGRGMGFMRGMGGIMGGRDMMGGPGMDGLMGGGLEANYGGEGPTTDGGPGNSRGRGGPHGGPFGGNGLRIDDSCKFATPTLTCGPTTRNGLTTTTVYTITSAANVAQSKVDETTNSIRTVSTVTGTTTRGRDGEVTATVSHRSERTVTGLANAAGSRTVKGTSTGMESASGTNREGKKFTSKREASDVTNDVVIPNAASTSTTPSYPTSGTVTRSMKLTTIVDGTTTTNTRSEVLTYNGTSTAKVEITENGVKKSCTLTLPRGKPSCN